MRKLLLVAVFAALILTPAFAGTSDPCLSSVGLDTYMAAGFSGCTIGNLFFSGFSYVSAPPNSVPPDQITVTVLNSLGLEGFKFNHQWTVSNDGGPTGVSLDSTIDFLVTGLNGYTIQGVRVDFNASQTNGNADFTETFDHAVPPINIHNPPSTYSAVSEYFAPLTSLTVSKDIGVFVDKNVTGNANISWVTNQFYDPAVPEPATMVLLGGGLLALAGVGRRWSCRR